MFDIVNPRQAIIVTCRGEVNILGKSSIKDNGITLTWYSPLSFNPPLFGIMIAKTRFSYKIVQESKVFCVNFMSFMNKNDVHLFGTTSGMSIDKFEKSNLTKEECDSIDCCKIKENVGFLECEVINEIETGDHMIFVGRVIKKQIKESTARPFYKGGDEYTSTKN